MISGLDEFKGILKKRKQPKRYRDQPEILLEILRLCAVEGGAHKTRVMYGAALSYNQANEYLIVCFEKGLLRGDADSRTFHLTEKGLKVLRALEEYTRLMDDKGEGKA